MTGQPVTPAETLALLRLSRTEGIGPMTWRRLMAQYGSGAAALDALPGHAARRAVPFTPYPVATAERELERLDGLGGHFLVWGTEEYPPLLALLDDAPPLLAVVGDAACLHARQVGWSAPATLPRWAAAWPASWRRHWRRRASS